MHPLEKKVLAIIRERRLLAPGETVVIGVSGGSDSMALLHVLAALAPLIPFRIVVALVNHLLRPQEAAWEEALVREQAAGLGLACRIKRIEVKSLAREQGLSLEHAGRQCRYEFFYETARAEAAGRIAVGHTADDQAEEVLLRLLRGTGRKGLAGMDYCRDRTVIRPFLDIPKAHLTAYLSDRGIPHLEDSSNQSPDFVRNRIRLELLPALAREFNPNIRATLRRTAAILREEEEYLAQATAVACARCLVEEPTAEAGTPVLALRKAEILALPTAIGRRVIEEILIRLALTPGFAQIEAVLGFCRKQGGRAILHLKSGLRVRNYPDRLVFSFPAGRHGGRGNLDEDRGRS